MTFDIPQKGNDEIGTSPSETRRVSDSQLRSTPTPSFDDVVDVRIALPRKSRAESVTVLTQILADTMTLRDLYKKHHWQTSGATFYELHQLFDKHYEEQTELIDAIAERIQILGGTAIAMAADVAVTTMITLPPRNREEPPEQLARLLDAHESGLHYVRAAARRVAKIGDDGTNDLLVSDVIRINEKQAWFVHELLQGDCVSRVP
jgi:starvation-inducible DNA-binding protein